MRQIKFVTGESYHIYNRGVEKRDIFLEHGDFLRFIRSLQELNKDAKVMNLQRKLNIMSEASLQSGLRSEGKLVSIICYCLMPNHFHFILKQLEDNGVSKFMHKIGTSYAKYFNLKHNHSGVLFQGVFKAKHIETDEYLKHLSRYIHLNPLEIIKNGNSEAALILRKYRWSSLMSYVGNNQDHLIELDRNIVLNQFKHCRDYENFLFGKSYESSSENEFS